MRMAAMFWVAICRRSCVSLSTWARDGGALYASESESIGDVVSKAESQASSLSAECARNLVVGSM